MADIIPFTKPSTAEPEVTAEDILNEAIGFGHDTVIVIGRDENGDLHILSNMGRVGEIHNTLMMALDTVVEDALAMFDCMGEPN